MTMMAMTMKGFRRQLHKMTTTNATDDDDDDDDDDESFWRQF